VEGGSGKHGSAPDHCPAFYSQPGEIEEHVQGKNLQACKNVLMFGAATNLTYSFLKIYLGSEGGSVAMLADGVHAFVDFGADTISYFSVHVTHRKYPRSRFPFGLGRFETLGSLIIACMLMSGGTALFLSASERLESSYLRMVESDEDKAIRQKEESEGSTCRVSGCKHTHSHERGGILGFLTMFACDHGDEDSLVVVDETTGQTQLLWSMIAVSVSCLVLKQVLFRWARSVGTKAGSRIVVANAFHHRADSWTSGIALVGILGQTFGIPFLDGLCGAFVSALIAKTGFQLFRNSMLEIFDFQSNDVRALGECIRTDLAAAGVENAINVFAVRHGHMYALNATVLVHSDAKANEPFSAHHIHKTQEKIRSLAKDDHKVALSALSVTTVHITDITANKRDIVYVPTTAKGMLDMLRLEGVNPANTSTNETAPSSATNTTEGTTASTTAGASDPEEVKRQFRSDDYNERKDQGLMPEKSSEEKTHVATLMERYAIAVDVLTSLQQFYGMKAIDLSEIVIDLQNNSLYVLRNPELLGTATSAGNLYGLVPEGEAPPTASPTGAMYQALELENRITKKEGSTSELSGRQMMLIQDLKCAAKCLGLACPQI